MKSQTLSVLFLFSLLYGCAGSQQKIETITADKGEAQRLLTIVENINTKRPPFITSELSVKVQADGQKYNGNSKLDYRQSPLAIRLTLREPLIRMLIADIFLDSQSLQTYIPVDTTVYRTSFTGKEIPKAGLNPYFISSVALGIIPLVKNFTDISAVKDSTAPNKYILRINSVNNEQEIWFENDLPYKTIIRGKNGTTSLFVEYDSPQKKNGYVLFKEISAASEPDGNKFAVKYSSFSFPVFITEKVFTFTVPPGTKKIEN